MVFPYHPRQVLLWPPLDQVCLKGNLQHLALLLVPQAQQVESPENAQHSFHFQAAEEDEEEEDSVQESFCGTAERCFRALCSETILGFKMVLSDPYLAQFLAPRLRWCFAFVLSGFGGFFAQAMVGPSDPGRLVENRGVLARRFWSL